MQCHSQEGTGDEFAVWKSERDVGNAQNGTQSQFFLYTAESAESFHNAVLFSGCCKGEAVDVHIFAGDAVFHSTAEYLLRNGESAFCGLWDAALVQSESHHSGTVLFNEGKYIFKGFILTVDRIYNGLAVVDTQSCFQNFRHGGIQLERRIADALNSLYRGYHHFLLVYAGKSHIYVQYLCAGMYLFDSLTEDVVYVMGKESLFETLLAGGIYTFSDDTRLVDNDVVHS